MELGDRQVEKAGCRTRTALAQVDPGGGELDQPLEPSALGAGRPQPDLLPFLVGFEVATLAECREAAREAILFGMRRRRQTFGSAPRIFSISAVPTYPSTRFTTFPEPSTKRTVG